MLILRKIITRKLSCSWETRETRQHSKFIQKKSIEIRNEHSVRLLRLHTAWNSVFSKWVSYSNYKYVRYDTIEEINVDSKAEYTT